MNLLPSAIRVGLPVVGYLLISHPIAADALPTAERAAALADPVPHPAAADHYPASPPFPRSFPGRSQGATEAHWIAPYVLYTSCSFPEHKEQVVRWYDEHGNILKEISGKIYEHDGFLEQDVGKKTIIHGITGLWKTTLRDVRDPYPFGGCLAGRGDTFIRRYHVNMEQTMVEIYSRGKLMGSAGPFLDGKSDFPQLSDDGCITLLVGKNKVKEDSQVVVISPDAKIRLQMDCPETDSPFAIADGKGVILRVESGDPPQRRSMFIGVDGTHMRFGPNVDPVACIPSSDLVLFCEDSEPQRFKLLHGVTGEILWNIASPVRRLPNGFTQSFVAGDKILLLGLDVAALDASTGKVLGVWKSQWKPGDSPPPWASFFRKGTDVYIETKKEFFKLDFSDIEKKTHGWE